MANMANNTTPVYCAVGSPIHCRLGRSDSHGYLKVFAATCYLYYGYRLSVIIELASLLKLDFDA